MAAYLLPFALIPTLVVAQNSTAEADRVGWVSAADTRGTSDILWSCFSIFLVCSWKCVHLNLPTVEESEAGWHTTLRGWLPFWPTPPFRRVISRKLKWILVTVLAPEAGVSLAAREFLEARKLQRLVTSPDFTLTHAFYAQMGGFAIAVPRKDEKDKTYKIENGLDYYSLDPTKLDALADLGFFAHDKQTNDRESFPQVTAEDIENQSKSDIFTKAFAVIQCVWLVVQSIARAANNLPLTELELATLAFIPCAVFMYGLWWSKPFDAQRAITLLCPADQAESARQALVPRKNNARFPEGNYDSNFDLMIPEWTGSKSTMGEHLVTLIFYLAALAFSGVHVIAWNWDFPSPAVSMTWRMLSLLGIGSVLVNIAAILFDSFGNPDDIEAVSNVTIVCTLGAVFVYCASRIGLLVLTFYCFSSMPADVYKAVDWNNVFPHFS